MTWGSQSVSVALVLLLVGDVCSWATTVTSRKMPRRLLAAAAVGLSLTRLALSQEGPSNRSSMYSAAFYSSGVNLERRPELVVFPDRHAFFTIPLPFPLGYFAYSRDGKSIYSEDMQLDSKAAVSSGLFRIEIEPMRVTLVAGSAGLTPLGGIAVTVNTIVASGHYQHDGKKNCGIFELGLQNGIVRKALDNPDCGYMEAWHGLSLSPDGVRAVAVRKGRLELIDLTAGTARVLGEGFLKAAWSPDGLWIAALENGGRSKTMLLDTSTFMRRKVLRDSEVVWSPDSRSLLVVVRALRCGPDFGSLAKVDVASGSLTTIPNSNCKINQPTTGWVSVARQ